MSLLRLTKYGYENDWQINLMWSTSLIITVFNVDNIISVLFKHFH